MRIDTLNVQIDTGHMDTNEIAALLTQARDITQNILGSTPDATLAEVFRQLCFDREITPRDHDDDDARSLH